MADKIFADGFSWKRREDAPEFVIGNLSCKVEDATKFLKTNSKKGWVNMNVLMSKNGKPYIELDTWESKPKAEVNDGLDF
tara:strand:- start:6611 stop:6850 length:240 start_codon:yes stop_codon:yes gene_type:complete